MPSCNNILAFIVVLIILAQALPPKIGKAAYTYDPQSIAQNEKILQLFLRLASGTANHLIRLKNEAKHRQETNPQVDKNELTLRINLPHETPERQNGKRENFERKGPFMDGYGRNADTKQSEEELDLCILSQRVSETPSRRENHEKMLKKLENSKNISTKNDSLEESIKISALEKESTEKLLPSSKSKEELIESSEKAPKSITTEDPTDLPMEIQSRIMLDVPKNDQINYKEYDNETINADTRIASSNSSNEQETSHVFQTGPVTLNHSAGFSEFQEIKINDNDNLQEVKHNQSESPDHVQEERSKFSSQDFGPLTEKPMNGTLEDPSGLEKMVNIPLELQSGNQNETVAKGIDHQALGTASNLLTESNETIHAGQGLVSNGRTGKEVAEGVHQDSTSTSNPQSGLTEIMDAAQGSVQGPNEGSRNEPELISHQVVGPVSNLQSESKGKTSSSEGLELNEQIENEPPITSNQDVRVVKNLQSESKVIINATQQKTSNTQSRNQTDGIAFQALGSPSNHQSGSSSIINVAQDLPSNALGGDETAGSGDQDLALNLQSGPSEALNAAQELTSNSQSRNQTAGIAFQALGPTSNHQSGSSSTIHVAQDLPLTALGGDETAAIGDQDLRAASSLQSGSSHLINAITDLVSNGQIGNQSTGIVRQPLNAESNLQPSSAEKVSHVNGSYTRQIIKSQSGNEVYKNSEKDGSSGLLDLTESEGILSALGNVLTNQKSSLPENPNHDVSSVINIGNGTSNTLINTVDAIGTSLERENPATGLIRSNAGEISQIGSRLVGALPLFRSFPNSEENSPLFRDETIKEDDLTEDIISERKCIDFAKKIAEALRPVDSRRKI